MLEKRISLFSCIAALLFAVFFIFEQPVFAATKPSVVDITGFSSTEQTVNVEWRSVSGAASYRIDRRKSGDDAYITIRSGVKGSSFLDTGLKPGTMYWYRVYAVNSAGTSSKPESKAAYTKCVMPTITQISSENASCINLTWTGVKGANYYRIDRRIDGVSEYSVYKTGISATSYRDTGLLAGTRYCYRIYAINGGGNASSKPAGVWGVTRPAKPGNVVVSPNGQTGMSLRWDPVKGAETYRIDRRIDGVSEYSVYKTGLVSTSFSDSGLRSDTRYCYRVYAVNAAGISEKPDGSWGRTEAEIPISSINLNYTSKTMKVGESIQLVATVYPTSVTNKSVTWSSSDSSVASVSSTGKVSANRPGSAKIKVVSDTTNIEAAFSVQVIDNTVNVSSVSLDKTSCLMKVGSNLKLNAIVSPANASNKTVAWFSSNSSVVDVDSFGNIRAKKSGSVTIKAQTVDGKKIASCTVKVEANKKNVTNTKAEKLAKTAEGQIGVYGTRKNGRGRGDYQKYGRWYGNNGVQWCAQFVSWCGNKAGISTAVLPKSQSTLNMGQKSNSYISWKKNGKNTLKHMKRGDVILFSTNQYLASGGKKRVHHVGIVTKVNSRTNQIETVEGNTGSDIVARRMYTVNAGSGKITKSAGNYWNGEYFCGYISIH